MSRVAPMLGEVREPRTDCIRCSRPLVDTCRACWKCAFLIAEEEVRARRDAGPAPINPDECAALD